MSKKWKQKEKQKKGTVIKTIKKKLDLLMLKIEQKAYEKKLPTVGVIQIGWRKKNSPSIFRDGKFKLVKEKEWKPSPSPKSECFKFLVKRIKKDKKGAAFPVAALTVSNRKTKRRNKTKKKRKGRFLNKCNFAYAGHDTVNISLTTLKRSTSSSTDVRK